MEESGYVYGFALLSTLIMVIIPAVVLSLDLTPTVTEMPPLAEAIAAIVTGLVTLTGTIFNISIFAIHYLLLGLAYISYAISLTTVDFVDDIENFFAVLDTVVDDMVTGINEFVTEAVSAYSILPAPLITVLLLPMLIAVFYAIIKALPFTG